MVVIITPEVTTYTEYYRGTESRKYLGTKCMQI